MSVEQMNDFHVVRRILRAIAPDYRLLASEEIPAGTSALDVKRKTIEVGETPDVMLAVSSLLFQIGHLMLRNDPRFALLFGDGVRAWKGTDEKLVEKLASLGCSADIVAYNWAHQVIQSYWPVKKDEADQLIGQHCWSNPEWKEYFAA